MILAVRIRLGLAGAIFLTALPGLAGAGGADVAPRENVPFHLAFVRNEGQLDPDVAFSSRTAGLTLFVTRGGRLVYALPERGKTKEQARGWTVVESPVGGAFQPGGAERAPTRVSYFVGNDPSRWKDGVATFREVGLGEVWPGIEVRLRADAGRVEKLFMVEPGADASRIRLRFDGARSLCVEEDGTLTIATDLGPIAFTPPVAYQKRGGKREPVAAAYEVAGLEYGFRIGPHDPALPVVVDPILQSTFAGGSGSFDQVDDVAFHPTTGNVYVAGFGNSTNFPGTAGGAQPGYGGGNEDALVAEYSPDLTTLLQATYLGGGAYDIATGLTVSAGGDVYVSGETFSTNFPGTSGRAQPSSAGGGDAWAARLSPSLTGTIVATYLGGTLNDHGSRSVAVDPVTGNVYVGGWGESKTFPMPTVAVPAGGAQTAFASSFAGWIVRLNSDLTQVLQRTFVGEATQLFALAFSPAGVYVSGHNGTPPALTGGAQTSTTGTTDAFVTLVNLNLTAFVRSTLFGADGLDTCFSIALNTATGDVYIAGGTSSLSLPGALGGAQRVRQGPTDNYVARFNGALTQRKGATYNGGTGAEGANGVAVDPATGDVFIAGTTNSTKLPGTTAGAQRIYADGGLDAFVVRFNEALTSVLGATFLGGGPDAGQPNNSGYDESIVVAFHPDRDEVYTAGYTAASDFPKTVSGAQPTRAGALNDTGVDGFVTRLTPDLNALFAPRELVVDPAAGASADGNGVFEPGETVAVQPSWRNQTAAAASISGAATSFTGPAGPTYGVPDTAASYGSVPAGATRSCTTTANCFSLSLSDPASRPASHWDATFIETPTPADAPMRWSLHVGDSFTDVPRSHPFYRKIETLFHNGVTLGCTATQYCLGDKVPRANMAIFIGRAIAGGAGFLPTQGVVNGTPYQCSFIGSSIFSDVAPTDAACPAIHYLVALNVATGCSASLFCTAPNVNRGEMAIFMARGVVAPGGGAAVPVTYGPDPVTGRTYSCNAGSPNLHFTDVPASALYCKHVHFLWAKGIIDGCGGTLYCPATEVTRAEMAKFLSNAFALPLYAP
jgi:hypothetical protein